MAITIPVSVDTESADQEFAKFAEFIAEESEKAAQSVDKSAKKITQGMTKATSGVGSGAGVASNAVEDVSKAVESFGDAAGKAGSNVGKLAGPLGDLVPGAGGAALAVQSFADVAEVGAAVAAALGVSLGALAAVALPLTAVVVGVGLAWQSYGAMAKEATDYQNRLNEALDGTKSLSTKVSGEIDKLKLNMGLLTQAQYDDVQIKKDWDAALESSTAKLRKEKDAIKEQMAAIGTANATYLKLQDRLHEINGLLETSTMLSEKGKEAALANAEVARERAESEKVLADRLVEKAKAESKSTESLKLATESIQKYRDAIFDVQMLVAEGQIAPGRKDIRNASEAMVDLTANLNGLLASYGVSIPKSQDFEQALLDLKLQAIDLDLAFSRGSITQAEYAKGQADNKAAVDATTEAIQKQAEATKKAAEDAVKSIQDTASAQEGAISQAQGGLASIVSLIAGPVAGAIASLIMNLSDTVDSLISQIASIPDILTSIPTLAVKLVQAIVDAVPAIVAAIPVLVDGLIDAVPTIITSLIVGLIAAIPSLIETSIHLFVTLLIAQSGWLAVTIVVELVKALAVELPKVFADLGRWLAQSWKRFVSGDLARDFADLFRIPVQDAIETAKNAILKLKEGVQTFFQYWLDAWKEILTLGMANTSLDGGGSKAWDATKEILTLGLAKTQYGDSPGMRQAGPQGMNLKASAGDYFAFSRTKKGLVYQALEGMGGAGQSVAAMAPQPVLVLSDHARQFDGLSYRIRRMGGGTSQDIAVRQRYANSRGY